VFMRSPKEGGFSIERVFQRLAGAYPDDVQAEIVHLPAAGASPLAIVRNGLFAMQHQGQINHIPGSVHYLAMFLQPTRTVLTVLDCLVLQYRTGFRRFLIWLLWYWLPVRRVSAVTTISHASMRELAQHVPFPLAKGAVVHCPRMINRTDAPPVFSRPGPATVLMIGTTVNKNIERSIAALAGLPVKVLLVGELNDTHKYAAGSLGVCVENKKGLSDEDVVNAYRSADLLLFASTAEGFGLPILEAQAMGRPVVTSNCSSMPEVGGEAAVYVDPSTVSDIRRGVEAVLRHPDMRERLIQEGYRNIERFHPSKIAEDYAMVYRRLTGIPELR
jgi:glycosyltransferase involved in cell wall biosynthesis